MNCVSVRLLAFGLVVVGLTACRSAVDSGAVSQPDESVREPVSVQEQVAEKQGRKAMKIELKSSAFQNGERIPRKYTGDGEDVSPPLSWSGVPEGAKELALICDDPDAPTAEPWVHWVIYGLSPELTELPEGIPAQSQIDKPVKALQGKNSWPSGRTVGYRGPAPPPGHGTHHYHFKFYALDQPLNLPPGVDKRRLLKAMQGHIIAQGELVGTYER